MNKKLTRILLMCLAVLMTAACTDKPLPPEAEAFIEQYFPKSSVVLIEMGEEDDVQEYEVWLNDGTKIEFDMQGTWRRVSRKKSGVPSSLVPEAMRQYIKTNYPNNVITKFSKKDYGYKVELSDDMDLRFNKQYQFIEVVD